MAVSLAFFPGQSPPSLMRISLVRLTYAPDLDCRGPPYPGHDDDLHNGWAFVRPGQAVAPPVKECSDAIPRTGWRAQGTEGRERPTLGGRDSCRCKGPDKHDRCPACLSHCHGIRHPSQARTECGPDPGAPGDGLITARMPFVILKLDITATTDAFVPGGPGPRKVKARQGQRQWPVDPWRARPVAARSSRWPARAPGNCPKRSAPPTQR
jgi:hypothetical protein